MSVVPCPSAETQRHGVHAVFKHLDDMLVGRKLVEEEAEEKFCDQGKLDQLWGRQIEAVRYVAQVFTQLCDIVTRNIFITVTAGHGELFGKEGCFGYGPIQDEEVYGVPLVEGKLR